MGLDMYLQADLYVGGKFEHRHVKGKCSFTIGKNHIQKYDIALNEISSITIDVGYWRKANAIHKWFVDNVQNGIDECQRSYVNRGHLETLKTLCLDVINDPTKAGDLLPTESGFFFGSTDFDEWYMEDIKETVNIIDKALNLPPEYDIYYQASW